ncbi:MAG: hypothetical protein JW837_12820 [Sedimentisphaerales bacterium]|nr:hypothetical protein [Sedimentisphaerales bacterium]
MDLQFMLTDGAGSFLYLILDTNIPNLLYFFSKYIYGGLWVDGDYHLKSVYGRWDPNSESWVMDEVTSPCIDAGDPNSVVVDEPEPNGGRINMGVYGGTKEASKSNNLELKM